MRCRGRVAWLRSNHFRPRSSRERGESSGLIPPPASRGVAALRAFLEKPAPRSARGRRPATWPEPRAVDPVEEHLVFARGLRLEPDALARYHKRSNIESTFAM